LGGDGVGNRMRDLDGVDRHEDSFGGLAHF
jgi:hypothetical protein